MNRQRQFPNWLGAALGTICALLVLALGAHASDHHYGSLSEEFHQTYAIAPEGRLELDNINGDVHISTWDRSEVKVDAVKYADSSSAAVPAAVRRASSPAAPRARRPRDSRQDAGATRRPRDSRQDAGATA
jgi:hypothetical protein